ncbi:MAG: N(G),N(G)-dimethylarginine dimethylaminohydrolase [Deferribacteres bacterium]|nr:N(G),N(G)-dimethylarginine dimethylaminohydrolase [candidate division KSB1 bacterium]MCB9501599.1 N(G),N(G)-dimethylarginine dimethylaminohydrolase [Deferribacteres bacterium]
MFSKAIVKIPCKNMVHGITTANLGQPDYDKALYQHQNYIRALQSCGLEIIVLEADENYPDSTFVEDTALLTPRCAVITRPGAESRRGEITAIQGAVAAYYPHIESIKAPGTVEAGDLMQVGSHFYIGLSERTNSTGAAQLIAILQKYGMTGSTVTLEEVLHLKTGVAYLENNTLLACGEFIGKDTFAKFNILQVDAEESYAANCIWVNGTVIVPFGFPETKSRIEDAGYPTIAVDVSEFQKLDGGLSCLSLRF